MAIDKNANMQDIDLDDIEVLVLIIAKTPAKIQPAANFLTRRGWPTTILTNLSQAIEFATDRKPDFVLISVNHPNPATIRLSDLLTTTFGATCVAFAENFDNASGARLAKSPIAAKIQGQASGPTLHRSLRKLLAEKLNIQLDDKGQTRSSGAKDDNGPTTIKGEKHEDEDNLIENEKLSTGKYTMSKTNRRSLRELSKAAKDASDEADQGVDQKALAAKLKKSLFGDAAEPEVTPDPADELQSDPGKEAEADTNRTTGLSAAGMFTQEAGFSSGDGPGTILPEATARGNESLLPHQTAPQSNESILPEQARAQGDSVLPRPTTAQTNEAILPSPATAQAQGLVVPTAGQTNATNEQKPRAKKMKSLASVGPHSLIERAVQAALNKICKPATDEPASVGKIEQVGVFPVDSPTLPGYLVIAWPHNDMQAIEPFFNKVQEVLSATFIEMNLQAGLESGFFVTLPSVDFGDWASKNSAFSFSTSHGTEEIGVAFFATKRPIPKPKVIEDKSMYSIALEHIPAEAPVTFKVYLHFKKNEKYFLYLRNGRQMQTKQKERLQSGQIKDLYMKTIDAENLRTFLATCYLTDIIKKKAG